MKTITSLTQPARVARLNARPASLTTTTSLHGIRILAAVFSALLAIGVPLSGPAQSRANEWETVLVFGARLSASGAKLRPGSVDPFFAGASANFPKPAGTTVLAARGSWVGAMQGSASQSCWNSNAQACQNCSGSVPPNFVKVRHRDGHFQNNGVLVSLNQRIYRGTPLGKVGTTGCSTGNHLHLPVVDPNQTTTVPLRFESYAFPLIKFENCYWPPSNSTGISTQ